MGVPGRPLARRDSVPDLFPAIGLVLGAGLSWYFGIEIDRGRAAIALV